MSLTVKIDPIDREIAAIIDEAQSPEHQSRALAIFAREQLLHAQVINTLALGRIPPHETFVDGRRGAPEGSVSPGGAIVYEFTLLEELFDWIGQQLVQHAPVLTGAFARSFAFFADDREVLAGERPPEAAEYVFTNTQPYTRKIEAGLSDQAADGVFEAVAVLAGRRFGNLARIRFGYRSVPAGAVGEWAATTNLQSKSGSRNRPGQVRTDWLTRQPSIIITTGR